MWWCREGGLEHQERDESGNKGVGNRGEVETKRGRLSEAEVNSEEEIRKKFF